MRVLIPILILSVCASLGCPIMDELNNANEEMDKFVGTEEEEAAESTSAGTDGAPRTPQQISREWWDKARSLNSKPMSPSIVRCRLNRGQQFMARDECLSRGGQPGDVSG